MQSTGSRIIRNKEADVPPFASTHNPRMLEDIAFLEAVRTGNRSLIKSSYADALKSHEVAVAANISAATGKPVRL